MCMRYIYAHIRHLFPQFTPLTTTNNETMNLEEMNERLDKLGNSWEHFKQVNNERLLQLEKKHVTDPLTEIKLEKLNSMIEEQKSKIANMEVALSRPHGSNEKYAPLENSSQEAQYKSAFNAYLKKGMEEQLADIETKRDLTTAIDTSTSYGGYLLTPNVQKIILDKIEEICVMRKICSIQEISSSSFDVIDGSNMTPSWISETGTINDTDSSVFTKKTISTHDLVAQPKVSQKLLDDAAIDLEQWLADRLANDFAVAEEDAFINGLGDASNQPTGILKYADATTGGIETLVSEDTTQKFNENDIMDLYYALGDKYVNNASFLMPRTAMKQVRMLKDKTSGQYLWNPALLAGQVDTLLGCPIYQSSHVPALDDDSKSIIFGDFAYYQIVDRVGIRILRDPFTSKPYVRFYTTKRVGGDVIDVNAFKVLVASSNA